MLKKHFVFTYHIPYPEAKSNGQKIYTLVHEPILFFSLSSFLFTPVHVCRKNLNWKKKEERKEVKKKERSK
jgi:hypothetical protein